MIRFVLALALIIQGTTVVGPVKIVGPVTVLPGSGGGGGGVALDNHCISAVAVASTKSCTLTISASAKAAVIFAGVASATIVVSTVTVGASSASQCTGGTVTASGETIEAWCLANPPSGSQTITVTWNSGAAATVAGVETFTGGTGTFTVFTPGSGTTSPSSVTGSSATGHLVADGLQKDEGTSVQPTVNGTGQTGLDYATLNSQISLSDSTVTGAATVTPGWVMTNDPNWREIAVDIS